MASSDVATRLTAAHRLAQVQIGTETVQQLQAVWPILDPTNLDGTTDDWMQVALAVIKNNRQASAELAATYMEVFRQLELGAISDWRAVQVLTFDIQQLSTSLRVTGPVRIKQGVAAGEPLPTAVSTAEATSAAAGLRHALNGGRETIFTSGGADRKVLGYARVTSGNPCAFCAMLAGRGPVYFSEETADFQPHDGCACFPEPVYSGDSEWPPGSVDFAQLYDQSTQGTSGRESIRAFRRAYDAATATTTVA